MKVTCKHCKKNFTYHSSMRNMMYHLKHVSSYLPMAARAFESRGKYILISLYPLVFDYS